MTRFWEFIFGLDKGFLGREGELSFQFNPHWPWQERIGAGVWNFLLIAAAVALIVYVYRREGRSRPVRVVLGVMRAALLALVIVLLNRPVLTLGQSRTEPSVLAILIDDSVSMRVRDMGAEQEPASRLQAVVSLLGADDQKLVRELAKQHVLKFYTFDQDAQPLTSTDSPGTSVVAAGDGAAGQKAFPSLAAAIAAIQPNGQNTQVLASVRTVLDDLQGQRLAGVVVLTDGRETPARPVAEALAAVKDFGVKVYPVALGSDRAPRNIDVQSVSVQDSAFKGDIVNVKVAVRGSGYPSGHQVTLVLRDQKTGKTFAPAMGGNSDQKVTLADDRSVEAELTFKPEEVGTLDLVVEAVKQPGELDDEDNTRTAQVAVLDAKIAVLYVDGYPRWDYRYIKNEMIRDKTVDISCLLLSALGSGFAQEGDRPITRFPESIQEMMEYDVVLFGDVDPRQLGDAQVQLISDFVANRGGGFGMVAGTRWSPAAFRNTAIEPILPVNIGQVEDSGATGAGSITQGFRPVLTTVGTASSIFRFYPDKAQNEKFLRDDIQPVFWYCRGVTTKAGVGEAYAEHPEDTGPDGRKAPVLVLGRFGAGRTMFSAIDDSWRWRFYTGESVFDTYWVQQLRYLARSKKLGQRRLTLTSLRSTYELGEQVRVNLRILDPQLGGQLPDQIRVEIHDAAGQTVRQETLVRQEGQQELYVASFPADRVGKFSLKLPPIAGGIDAMDLPLEIAVPRLELNQPQVDRTLLSRLASETLGEPVAYADASTRLPALIQSAAKVIPVETSQPLWDAPLALILFATLITLEWVLRKAYGML